jgi:hypothetical protein
MLLFHLTNDNNGYVMFNYLKEHNIFLLIMVYHIAICFMMTSFKKDEDEHE